MNKAKKDNILTYSYKGLVATVYTIMRKKDKIRDIFYMDDGIETAKNDDGKGFVDQSIEKNIADQKKKLIETGKQSFRYTGLDAKGKKINSTFDAYNIEQAKKFLIDQGITLKTIAPRGKGDVDINIGSPLSTDELAFALTQIATYLRAGITLIDSVKILAKQTQKPQKRKIYELIIYDLLSGDSFSDSLEKQPKVFPQLLVNMVKSSELTGDLPSVLDDMANYYTSIAKTKSEVKSAMAYPVIVMILAVVVVAFVLIWVVPQYESMFSGFGADLPTITVYTLALSKFLQEKAISLLLIIIAIAAMFIYCYRRIRSFRWAMQVVTLHIPVVKNLIMYSEISTFTKTFASLLNHGVKISDSMEVLLKVSQNEVYRNIIRKTVSNLSRGGKVSESFKDNPVIPIVAYEMIVTGEETGKLGEMMEKVYEYYDNERNNAINALKSLIEPILIIFLAGTVGLIILAVILPMFSMYETLSK